MKRVRRSPRTARSAVHSTARPALDWFPRIQPALMAVAFGLAWFAQEQLWARQLSTGLWLWLAAACAAWFGFRHQTDRLEEPGLTRTQEMFVVGGIVLIALGVRLWRLSSIPNGYFFDEGMNGLIGLQMLKDPTYVPLFGPPDAPAPTLFHYLNAAMLGLGGVSALASKMVPVFLGTATVAAFYFLLRRVVSWPVALAGALLLALMRWHINFSRINFIGIATPLFSVMAAYFLLRGLETRDRWHMALSGLAVSLGLYTYYASNLVPFVLGPYLALQLAWDKDFLRQHWRGVLIFLVVAVAVFAPLGWFAASQPGVFFARNNQVLIFNHVPSSQAAMAFWQNVRTTLLMFNYFGDTNGRHNIPEQPMLDPLTGLLFGLGLIWALTHCYRKPAALACLWFLVALVPGFLTIEAPQGYRCIGAIPAIALLAALGLERLWQSAKNLAQNTVVAPYLWAGIGVIVLIIGQRNLSDYFELQAQHMACWSEFSAREAAIGNRIHQLGPQYHQYISSAAFNYPTVRFLAYPYLEAEPFSLTQSIPSGYRERKGLVYCLLPIHEGAIELLQTFYPRGEKQTHASPYDFNLFTEYVVSPEELEANRGLDATYVGANGAKLQRREHAPSFSVLPASVGLPLPLAARWDGSWRARAWGTYRFQLQGVPEFRLWLDDQRVDGGEIELAQGLHRLRLEATCSTADEPVVLLQTVARADRWEPVLATELVPLTEVHGLTGSYWVGLNETARPAFKRIDPLISLLGEDFPLGAPFSARWEGRVNAPVRGVYTFGTQSNELSQVMIDGRPVVNNQRADTYQEGTIQLESGWHRIRIGYQKRVGAYPQLVLFWATPGRPREKVPYSALTPVGAP